MARQRPERRPRDAGEASRPRQPRIGRAVQATIELLAAIDASDRAADAVIAEFVRERPWLAGAERGAVLRRADLVLHRRSALDWWVERLGHGLPAGPRTRVLVALMLMEERKPEAVSGLFSGERFEPAPLGGRETALVAALAGRPLLSPEMPLPVRASFPAWLQGELERAFGDRLEAEMQALTVPAALDLRVNLLRIDREGARATLASEGLESQPMPLSPTGLRAARRADLGRLGALRGGLVEPQDEGSQIAALLVDARPGQYVIDCCAGTGGKTLALAAAMANRGRLVAADVLPARLERARLRLRRSGVQNAERRDAADRKWFKRQAGRVDRVLVDAPCTGIGSWRRIPDGRWRLRPDDLPELVERQRAILDQAAPLVAPGGRLVYVTCSVLPAENEGQVEWLLARRPEFRILPVADVWGDTVGGACPTSQPLLQLTPARHGTGGFFVAVLERLTS